MCEARQRQAMTTFEENKIAIRGGNRSYQLQDLRLDLYKV